jgi:UDP-N-acetylglucosamine:LPS N-acetylglucosamine transferase
MGGLVGHGGGRLHRGTAQSRCVTRVLILTANIGAGHDLPAELLAAGLRERGADVEIADSLSTGGTGIEAIARAGMETVLHHAPWLFDVEYWLIARRPRTRRLFGAIIAGLGARGLLALIAREAPDVIVSTYPGTTETLGRLRRAGRLATPTVSAITDLAALRWWAHPGIDLHLIIHAQSRAEVEAIAGPSADIRHVRGLVRPEYEAPPSRAEARAALGLPADAPVVVVSGGGWGVGRLEVAARAVLAVPDAVAVCLCGTNEGVRSRLASRGDPRIRAEGFTDRMCEWLCAADALIHSTAGLTVLEAELCGTWPISFGWGVGHIRINNRAYEHFGLATVARTEAELSAALRAALATPRPRTWSAADLPAAADAVLEVAARRPRAGL